MWLDLKQIGREAFVSGVNRLSRNINLCLTTDLLDWSYVPFGDLTGSSIQAPELFYKSPAPL